MVGNDDRSKRGHTRAPDTSDGRDERTEIAGSDELYCSNCGRVIDAAAGACPYCGAGRQEAKRDLTERRQYELETIATKSMILGAFLGFFPPLGYVYVGRWGWALLNALTFNYLLLGFLLVPLHVSKIISDARSELREAGVGGY